MAKVIFKDGTEEFMSPAAARQAVAEGKGQLVETYHTYSTRQMVAEPVKTKTKRKRRTKAEIEAEEVDTVEPTTDGETDCEAE